MSQERFWEGVRFCALGVIGAGCFIGILVIAISLTDIQDKHQHDEAARCKQMGIKP